MVPFHPPVTAIGSSQQQLHMNTLGKVQTSSPSATSNAHSCIPACTTQPQASLYHPSRCI